MKTIILATDFSAASQYAFQYGVILAQHINAKVKLVHVIQPVLMPESLVPVTTEELQKLADKKLKEAVDTLPFKSGLSISCEVLVGDTADCIIEAANEAKAYLVIAGMKGEGKTIRRFFGSTAMSLSRLSPIPVIVVPEGYCFVKPSSIALATDINNESDMHILDPLIQMGELFNSTVYLVRVIKRKRDELVNLLLRPSRLKSYLKQLHPSFEFVSDQDVTLGLSKFINNNDVQMVTMIAHEHTFLNRLLVRSNINEMMFTTNVPLLVLPGKLHSQHPAPVESIRQLKAEA